MRLLSFTVLSSLMVLSSAIFAQGIAVQAESQPTNLDRAEYVTGSRSRNTSYRGSGRRAVLAFAGHCQDSHYCS